jgi:membrane-associated phospholipid phosphatase
MLNIIEQNRLYFAVYLLLFFAVFWSQLDQPLLGATLYFSAHRTPEGDVFFKYWTLLGEIYPYILVVVVYAIFRKNYLIATKAATAGVVVLLFIGLLKEIFQHPRPAHLLDTLGLSSSVNYVAGVHVLRGDTSFPSGHTASAFALMTILALQYRRYRFVQILFLLAAFLVGVSRVYLVQHFQEDALFGSVLGITVALGVEFFMERSQPKREAKIIHMPQQTDTTTIYP